jgi:hypothetical protein
MSLKDDDSHKANEASSGSGPKNIRWDQATHNLHGCAGNLGDRHTLLCCVRGKQENLRYGFFIDDYKEPASTPDLLDWYIRFDDTHRLQEIMSRL